MPNMKKIAIERFTKKCNKMIVTNMLKICQFFSIFVKNFISKIIINCQFENFIRGSSNNTGHSGGTRKCQQIPQGNWRGLAKANKTWGKGV